MLKHIALACLIAAPVAAQEVYVVPVDRTGGGSIGSYVNQINALNRAGTAVQITAPACSSACTFFLLADRVCVSGRTVFEFHGSQEIGFALLGLPIRNIPTESGSRRIEIANAVMIANYNTRWPGMGDWFEANAADKFGFATTRVRGSALNKSFGIPLCETDDRQP